MGTECSTHGVKLNVPRISVGKPEVKSQLGRPRFRQSESKIVPVIN
jgi:hypothetical protein